MKRILSAVLIFAMILSCGMNVFAAGDEIANLFGNAKSRLSIPASFEEFESSKYSAGGEDMYTLSWRTKGDKKNEINATVLSTGEIVSYHYYDAFRDYDKTGAAAFDKEEYLKRAKEWINKVNPEYAKELNEDVEVNIGGVHSYDVGISFGRIKGEIPVYGDHIYISLDKYTGAVISMNSQWTNPEKIDSDVGVISAEAAGEILGGLALISLNYEKLHGENRAVLMYSPAKYGFMIDAVTGEEFTVEYTKNEDAEAGGMSGTVNDSATNEKFESALTEEELKNIEEMESLLSEKELSAIVAKMAGTAIASFKVRTVNYRSVGSEEEKKYEARLQLSNDEGESGNVVFDALTGELKSFYTYTKYNSNKSKNVSSDKMRLAAERFIKKWASAEAESVELFDKPQGGYFVFSRSENGIRYAANNIRIRIDEATGKILSFSKYWENDIEFDSPDGIITREEAVEKYIKAAGATLFYIGNGRNIYASRRADELRLIYRFSDTAPSYIDAKSGESYDWSMGQEDEKPEEYVLQADLSGHWAEKAVKVLADNGIILSYEENFRPDEAIKQKEVAFLVDCFDGAYPYKATDADYKAVLESFIRRDIIKENEKKPESFISREETVTYLVRLFGYEKAAEISGIYKTGFSDEKEVSADKLGYVAIAKGIGLISGSGGAFNPTRNVTRGELAVMLYNALGR